MFNDFYRIWNIFETSQLLNLNCTCMLQLQLLHFVFQNHSREQAHKKATIHWTGGKPLGRGQCSLRVNSYERKGNWGKLSFYKLFPVLRVCYSIQNGFHSINLLLFCCDTTNCGTEGHFFWIKIVLKFKLWTRDLNLKNLKSVLSLQNGFTIGFHCKTFTIVLNNCTTNILKAMNTIFKGKFLLILNSNLSLIIMHCSRDLNL